MNLQGEKTLGQAGAWSLQGWVGGWVRGWVKRWLILLQSRRGHHVHCILGGLCAQLLSGLPYGVPVRTCSASDLGSVLMRRWRGVCSQASRQLTVLPDLCQRLALFIY